MRHYLTTEARYEIEMLERESGGFDDWADKLEAVRQIELCYTLGGYLLGPQGDHVWASQTVEVRYPWLAAAVVYRALCIPARDLFRLNEGNCRYDAPARTVGAARVVRRSVARR